jgi:predicted DNA-binding protein
MKPETRGGARKGAGRKPRSVPLTAITVRIEPEAADKLKTICKASGKSQAAQITEWIRKGI